MAVNGQRGWEITFTDMLILLLTFFVFIISISNFETFEYKKIWENGESQKPPREEATSSFKFDLIKGLQLPKLNHEAERLLNEIEELFVSSDFKGVDVNYDENKISLMVSEQLIFEGGKFDLKEESKELLRGLVEPIQSSKFDVSIEGHSDALTSPKIDNLELSLNRALVVARFFIENGINKEKISVSGYGPYRPIASNKTVEGRQLNRRVEVHLIVRND